MGRTWLGVGGLPGRISHGLAMAAAIGGWRCAVDNRSPKEVVGSEMPSGDGSDTARFSKVPNGGAAGSGAVVQTGGAAGSGPTDSGGMGTGGTDSGAAGS